MKTYALDKGPPGLAALVEEVKHGGEIVLTDHEKPVAKLVPMTPPAGTHTPKAGSLKGFWMSPDFDDPLEDFKEYME